MHHAEIEIIALLKEREWVTSKRRLEEARHLREHDTQANRSARTGRGILHTVRQRVSDALCGRRLWPALAADAQAREPIPIGAEHAAPIAPG
jgi:hypothetical protein